MSGKAQKSEDEQELPTDFPVYAVERQQALQQTLRTAGRVEVAKAARELNVTTETIRKDLAELEHQGLLRRVRGGAVVTDGLSVEPAVQARTQYSEEKQRIARRAIAELPKEGSILVDAGSTTTYFAEMLPADRTLTIFTNTLTIGLALVARPRFTVYVVGGRVRERTFAEVDDWAIRALAEINVDVAFIGTNGLSLDRGLTTPDPAEAAVKSRMLAAGRRVVLLADHSKVDQVSLCRYGSINDVDLLITDAGLPEATRDKLVNACLDVAAA